jgi:hypothetical protein
VWLNVHGLRSLVGTRTQKNPKTVQGCSGFVVWEFLGLRVFTSLRKVCPVVAKKVIICRIHTLLNKLYINPQKIPTDCTAVASNLPRGFYGGKK